MISWFRKILGKPAPAQEDAPGKTTRADDIADLERFITQLVAAGYESPQQILESASDYMAGTLDARTIDVEAGPMLERALAAHAVAERHWPKVTDYDRLTAAFAALEARGIVARENFSCCGTCGSSEIWDEIDDARSSGPDIIGYTFFHMQDTESATEGDGLYLSYGAVEEGVAAALGVAATVIDEIARSGLTVDWDGNWDKRIGVMLDWKRRRDLPQTPPGTTLH